jgi:hypothetical protein
MPNRQQLIIGFFQSFLAEYENVNGLYNNNNNITETEQLLTEININADNRDYD